LTNTEDVLDYPDVLDVIWRVSAQGGEWNTAVELGDVVMGMDPGRRGETKYALSVAAWRLQRMKDARAPDRHCLRWNDSQHACHPLGNFWRSRGSDRRRSDDRGQSV
jgi:hypothetical protein